MHCSALVTLCLTLCASSFNSVKSTLIVLICVESEAWQLFMVSIICNCVGSPTCEPEPPYPRSVEGEGRGIAKGSEASIHFVLG